MRQSCSTVCRASLGSTPRGVQGMSMVSGCLLEDPQQYYVVGTGVNMPEDQEPSRGRILVFQVLPRTIPTSPNSSFLLVTLVLWR